MRRRGEASASARAGGGAPAPVKKSKTPLVALNDLLSGKPRCSRWPGLLLSQEVPMKRLRDVGGVLVLAAAIFGPTLVAGQQPPAGQPPAGGFPDLVGGLKATPGCLGVETARTSSGKQVIFAWFEDKKAALAWYYSETHRAAMKQFFQQSEQSKRTPLADVPDDGTPILAIASLTLADKSQPGAATFPFSQIAIELYRPLPGGLALGGRFAPATVKVPGMVNIAGPSVPQEKK